MTLPKVPFIYRLIFLYFEPLGAVFGAYITLTSPSVYLSSLSPHITSTTYLPLTRPIYDQIAAHLLLFAWCEGILLRFTHDVRLWKVLFSGILVCDVLHLYGQWGALGTEMFLNPAMWRWQDWVNFVTLYGQGALRIAFCARVGLGKNEKES